jgi:glycosyltransferase involved in cell wall biosynthesis
MVGRLHPAKGQLTLLQACRDLGDRLPGMRVVFAGAADPYEPAYEGELTSRAAELGLSGRVAFLGYRDDAVELTAGFDALAMPSTPDPVSGWREGLPLAPLEAMAVGTPVVGYDEPGIAEALGHCGELVPGGDSDAFREAIARLLTDAELRERLAACGRERVREFELGEAARRMQGAYAAALESDSPARVEAAA